MKAGSRARRQPREPRFHVDPSQPPDAKALDTASRLFDCALTVFAEKGYDATSVRDIIAVAGVTQPTLYYYCDGKLDLFRRLVRQKYDESLRSLRASIAALEGWEARLRAIVAGSFAQCALDHRVPRLMFQTAFGPPIPGVSDYLAELSANRFALVREVVLAGVTAGELEAVNVDGLTLALCCLMDQHINLLARQPDSARLLTPELAHWLVDLFLRGAATRPNPVSSAGVRVGRSHTRPAAPARRG